jgi:hypothetical protein
MGYGEDQFVTVEVEKVLHVGDKAVLCLIEGESVWIPISQIDPNSELINEDRFKKGGSGEIIIPAWLAAEKGLD